jgi:hypothetical protein
MIEYKNFPNIPLEIEKEIYTVINSNTGYFSKFDQTTELIFTPNETSLGVYTQFGDTFDGQVTARFDMAIPPKSLIDWLYVNNIAKTPLVGIQVISNGTLLMPHVDEDRTHALNYILDTGGNNVITSLYQPRDEFKNYTIEPQSAIPYDRIDCIQSEQLLRGMWHIIPVSQIHDVRNLDTNRRRISVSISLSL